MSIATGGFGQAKGTVPLSTKEAQKKVVMGYESGLCPGKDVHLALRFEGQPATGIDGREFPAELWEQSPKFTLPGQSILLAGVGAFTTKLNILKGPLPYGENTELDRAAWKQALSKHMNVTAQWFVLHDTAGGDTPKTVKGIPSDATGVNLFMNTERVLFNRDFSSPGRATKFEQKHSEFAGKMIHVENAYAAALAPQPNPPPPPKGYNYDALALAYIFASYRAKQWLTVTCHLETDRGIPGGHWDPRGFDYELFYRKIIASMGGPKPEIKLFPPPVFPFPMGKQAPTPPSIPEGSTFGILKARIGDGQNQANYVNTFPAQYGPVLTESNLQKSGGGKKKATKKK